MALEDERVDRPDDASTAPMTRRPPDDDPAPPLADFKALFAEAEGLTAAAVRAAEAAEQDAFEAMAERLRAEQARLLDVIVSAVPGAVREAAAAGQRTAVVLRFTGADKLDEFCYLYMLKGPHNPEAKAEMRRAGVTPLLRRLRQELAPFKVWHAWQRATNDNTLTVSW